MTDVVRPSWDEVWMETAQIIAKRSRCSRRQIGAVIVTADQRVVSLSYNGPPSAYAPANEMPDSDCTMWCSRSIKPVKNLSPDYSDCPAGHSELNAIGRANFTETQGSTIFVTGSVCIHCAKAIAGAKLIRVVMVVSDTDSHRNPAIVQNFLENSGVEVITIRP